MTGSRAGKYCPRCHAMTFIDREICENCGHRFSTGVAAPPKEPDALHKTQMFTLPQIARPTVPPEGAAVSPDAVSGSNRSASSGSALGALDLPPVAARRRVALPARFRIPLGLCLLAVCLGLGWAVHVRLSPPVFVGEWEKVFGAASRQAVTVDLALQRDGTGVFSWQQAGGQELGPTSGKATLHWEQDDSGQIALNIEHPPTAAPAPGTLIDILNSHHWLYSVDSDGSQLHLGTVSFARRSRHA